MFLELVFKMMMVVVVVAVAVAVAVTVAVAVKGGRLFPKAQICPT